MIRRAALVLGVLALASGAVVPHRIAAQSLQFGRFEGSVRDAVRRPIHDAEVRVVDRTSGAARWTKTDREGTFRFDALLGGRYDVFVEALGFIPVVHLDVRIGTAHTTQMDATLRVATPPVVSVDSVQRQGEVGSGGRWMVARGYGDLVGARRIGGDISAFSTTADRYSVEGLPWRMTGLLLDGAYAEGLGAPRGSGADVAALAMPVRGMSFAEVGGLGFDVEVGGSGLGLRSGTLRGGRTPSARALLEGGTSTVGGAYIGGGPMQGDTAQAIGGVDYQRTEDEAWPGVPADARRITERVGGFGRLDWQASERLSISARASVARLTSSGPRDEVGLAALYGRDYEALNAQAALNIFGRLTRRISHEWRVSTSAAEASGSADGASRVSDALLGVTSGSMVGEPFNSVGAVPRISGMLHVDAGAHRLKAGLVTAMHRYDLRFAPESDGIFAVGRALGDPSPAGAWRRVEPASYAGEFRMRETGLFVQDAWQVAGGLSVLLGLRLDQTRLPSGNIEANGTLASLSGLDNAAVAATSSRTSPRLGFRWELGSAREWVLEGGAGTYHALPDARDIAEALTLDAGASVRYGVGALALGAAPSVTEAPVVGQAVTLLAPDFVGPRTQRLSLGLTRRLGEWSASVSGVYRNTDFIARRRDLNLPASPVGFDQYGRPLQGALRQEGEVLVAEPVSNRRFAELDAVYALENTGYSEFWGATVEVERVLESGLSFGLQYTFSQTRDNVVGFAGTRLSPFPAGLNGNEWEAGRSDFDIPHRVLLTAEWRASQAFRLGLAYRLHSGLPFTPGVRGGVDANGDGDWRNDPAFVDPGLPGMAELIADNACLRSSVNRFAQRNACREDLVHRVDLRAAIGLGQTRIGRFELTLDALDLISVNAAPVDRALVRVDPVSVLTTDPGIGLTTVGYISNPAFGQRIGDWTPGAFFRIGVRVTP
ncbi:MAG: TonB-dependent receptor [Gemmatimonadaceae bacterium]|nr:TonB-dependent receptor [Gemmatimonadaceae bacterium]